MLSERRQIRHHRYNGEIFNFQELRDQLKLGRASIQLERGYRSSSLPRILSAMGAGLPISFQWNVRHRDLGLPAATHLSRPRQDGP